MEFPPDSGSPWAWAFVVYRGISGFPGYCVGSDGSVWSRRIKGGHTKCRFISEWRQKAATRDRSGPPYPYVRLADAEGRLRKHYVHRLVLGAFFGPCPEGMEGCHTNGNPTDNRLSNLRWDTPKANAEDKLRHGTEARGERSGGAKLTADQVREIRRLRAECPGMLARDIAILFGCSTTNVRSILRRQIWVHV